MDGDSPRDAAKREAAEQAVALAFGILMVAVYTWGQRAMTHPDALRSLRMRWAKLAERTQARFAAAAWRGAERARVAYEAERGSGA